MTTTKALLVVVAFTLPTVSTAHPCEAEVAKMQKDLEAIRQAVAALEAGTPSDLRSQMLAGAKGKYELEAARTAEARTRCERLIGREIPAATPAPAAGAAAIAVPPEAAPAETEIQMPGVVPCFPGCGKDTDCKGDRICVKGECIDPPARKAPAP